LLKVSVALHSGSTDIGTAVVYAVVFFALYGLDRLAVPPSWSVDSYIVKRLPWWAFVANPRPETIDRL